MAQFKIELTVVLEGQNQEEVTRRLTALLGGQEFNLSSVAMVEVEQAQIIEAPQQEAEIDQVAARQVVQQSEEHYVTYRVADEKFRVFANDFSLPGTELKVPMNRDFLMFRVKAFLEELGYKVEPKTNVRIVAESHVEQVPIHSNTAPVSSEVEVPVMVKRNPLS